jgi:hypothetical protein
MSIEMPEIKRLFMLLHGMYGNQLLDKYRTGKLNDKGEDMGILSAQAVWLNDLKNFNFEVIRLAVEKCKDRHQTYVPTLPEFLALCKASVPRRIDRPAAPQLAMSDELKAEIRQKNREMIAGLKLGTKKFGGGLQGLMQMVAKAVGDAGGDEVKALLAMESHFDLKRDALRH